MPRTLLTLLLLILCACAGAPRPAAASPATPAVAPTAPSAPDPLTTDPDKYSLVLENEHVRILRYHDQPGAKTSPHHHRAFVLVVLAPFKRRLIFPDGTVKDREFKAGDTVWMPEQVHSGENIGTTDTDVLLIEVK
jgi:quercetin dioxygenase-like cupin family protein